jgi:transposase
MSSEDIMKNFELRKKVSELTQENKELKISLKKVGNALSFANNKIKQMEEQREKYIDEIVQKITKEYQKIIDELNKQHQEEINKLNTKINSLEKLLRIDSTNSGTPTSKEKIGKHTVQNNREKSNKSKGAQPNHKQHKLNHFSEEEITETIEHKLDKCPDCGGELIEKNMVLSDIIDIEINVKKTRNKIHNYKCSCCHKNITANKNLPRGVSYGDNINSIALSMMNESNTALNKITSFLSGITNNEVNLCEGYLVKLQKKSANNLENFNQKLKEKIVSLNNLFWDDTVCKFGIEKPEEGYDEKDLEYLEKREQEENKNNVRNGIIRFYGDDNWALLIGHRYKNEASVDSDGILDVLPKTCTVMHDHLLLNYNDKYSFQNAECNEHTKRYLKKNIDAFPQHNWAKKMRKLLIDTNKRKIDAISNGKGSFTKQELDEISNKYDSIIKEGYLENENVNLTYIKDIIDEKNLIERLEKYKENHLLFAYDFSVSFTNNTSERGLRQVKRKLAVAFMFKNANRMKDYATILSYLETCYRNGISRYEAAKRLVQNNPYTVEEINDIVNGKEGE